MKLGLVIPAAGSGERMDKNKNKLFLKLKEYPVIVHTLKVFLKNFSFSEINLIIKNKEKEIFQKKIIEKYNMENINLISGGKTRRKSVYFGLKAFSPDINYVIIHDGARPLLPVSVIKKVISKLKKYNAVTTGVPVKNTIKIKSKNNFVEKTLNRNNLVAIHTPQGFKLELIKKAHQQVSLSENISDDAGLVEKIGHSVKIVESSYENIKITTPDDLLLAKLILQRRKK